MSDQEPTTEQTDHPIAGSGRRPPWVSGGVASVGAASFFSDTGHEIATAVLPSFLTSVLRGSAGVLGVIEGLSDGLLGIAKLVASPAPKDAYGRSFGVERAGDNLGAVLGPLLAALLVAVVGIRHAFFFALVPGLFAALAISVAAAKAPRVVAVARERARLELGNLRRAGLFGPLLPVAAFELGNVTTTLLILRVTQLLHHGDRSLTTAASLALLLFCLAGAGIGLAETAESTLVAHLLPDRLRGSGFGLLGGLQSAGDFLSSAVVGVLYAAVSPTAGFAYAAGWMVLSVTASALLRPHARQAAA